MMAHHYFMVEVLNRPYGEVVGVNRFKDLECILEVGEASKRGEVG